MKRRLLCLFLLLLSSSASHARELTFEDRVAAQATIERVRYAHRSGATLPFDEALPHGVLERRVETYLKENAALERVWDAPVTSVMLERELRRMARASLKPERLAELFSALGGDAFLIQECLVRPVLVDRLARQRFASDPQIHDAARRQVQAIHDGLVAGTLDPAADHPRRRVQELRVERGDEEQLTHHEPGVLVLQRDDFEQMRKRLPAQPGQIGTLIDGAEAYSTSVILEERSDRVRVATYSIAKRTWDEWWAEIGPGLPVAAPSDVARSDVALPETAAGRAPCPSESWIPGVLSAAAFPRYNQTAVWTGNEMIVWGGSSVGGWTQTGARYDPSTDAWTATSLIGAPSARTGHTAVWTGSLMVVWGDVGNSKTGGRYDPLTDSWSPTSTVGAPTGRSGPTAVWTGSEAIFWGGYVNGGGGGPCDCCVADSAGGVGCNDSSCQSTVCAFDPFCCSVAWDSVCAGEAQSNCSCCSASSPTSGPTGSGGRYNPTTDTWLPTPGGAPSARSSHTAVWTGTEMIIWGGFAATLTNTGGRYDPAANTWIPTTTSGAPSARYGHTAVWSGTDMIVWGGNRQNDGAHYDPVANVWHPTPLTGAPPGRSDHTAIWTGSQMIVWGGFLASGAYTSTGGVYSPATPSWAPTSNVGAPGPRSGHTMVWTGSEAIVWGGHYGSMVLGSGGRYDLASNSWTPTFEGYVPDARKAHTAIWTGAEMIVWGGEMNGGDTSAYSGTGGRYDPATDAWVPTTGTGAPTARAEHTAIWTGNRMIIWGGYNDGDQLNTGARYDPIADSWSATSTAGNPGPRSGHTAIWTGNRMIVWGGSGSGYQNTGGRYDPVANTWASTTTAGAPTARGLHSAVWTGQRMVVWGGHGSAVGGLQTGGLYDPTSDSWAATALSGAPQARFDHTATWTGSRMIIWGGAFTDSIPGGLYDPATNNWFPMSLADAPKSTNNHSAVWASDRMIVWGGDYGSGFNSGAYFPPSDTWQAVTTVGAPAPRYDHSVVWTGNRMIVWGGKGVEWFANGGIYEPGNGDADGDGLICAFDCDDANPAALRFPFAVENMHFRKDKVTLDWPNLKGALGSATAYDVARGSVAQLPVGGGPAETCLVAHYAPPTLGLQPVTLADSGVPPEGEAFWYLVRATNPCGVGTYGNDSSGAERVTAVCP